MEATNSSLAPPRAGGGRASMGGKKSKGTKGAKKPPKVVSMENVNKVADMDFAGNAFSGYVKSDVLGIRCFQGRTAKYVWPGQATYEGPFQDSQISGSGKFTWPDGSVYEGKLVNGKRHGRGTYTSGDGAAKYEGEWRQGKRHGRGRLSYGTAGDAFYEGEWCDGSKHGHGTQVWPSGNTYEGQWRLGRMAGEGSMLWSDGGVVERYHGLWEADRPEGEGAHTWETSGPPQLTQPGARDMPSQQMNNGYTGQWHEGVRHGQGRFSYANGASYNGDWKGNCKDGHGRYTYEDGRVYDGEFTGDAFAERGGTPGALSSESLRVLNIGAEDNPVRRCIDITDLNPLCLPPDVGALDLEIGSGYDEDHEVMREVFNMLLRYLAEAKQVYNTYRLLLRRPGEDPFVLTSHQLWLACRDMDLATTNCPPARLNRAVFAGPRHHLETAHTDLPELRPLSPRLADTPTAAALDKDESLGSKFRRVSRALANASHMVQRHGTLQSEDANTPMTSHPSTPRSSMNGENMWESSDHDRKSFERSRSKTRSGCTVSSDRDNGDQTNSKSTLVRASGCEVPLGGAVAEAPAAASAASRAATDFASQDRVDEARRRGPAGLMRSRFWRPAVTPGSTAEEEAAAECVDLADIVDESVDLADIHASSNKLMLRHFLEGIVRMSVARFPNEKGLEHQVRRLFKEKLLPLAAAGHGKAVGQQGVMAFLADEEVTQVLKAREATLFKTFEECHPGEAAACGAPPWAQAASQFAPGLVFGSEEAGGDAGAAVSEFSAVRSSAVAAESEARSSAGGTRASTAAAAAEGGSAATEAVAVGGGAGAEVGAEAGGGAAGEGGEANEEEAKEEEVAVQPGDHRPLRAPPLEGRRRRCFPGSCQRRVHVCARLDATVRIKDVFRLLDESGLLLPVTEGWGTSSSSCSSGSREGSQRGSRRFDGRPLTGGSVGGTTAASQRNSAAASPSVFSDHEDPRVSGAGPGAELEEPGEPRPPWEGWLDLSGCVLPASMLPALLPSRPGTQGSSAPLRRGSWVSSVGGGPVLEVDESGKEASATGGGGGGRGRHHLVGDLDLEQKGSAARGQVRTAAVPIEIRHVPQGLDGTAAAAEASGPQLPPSCCMSLFEVLGLLTEVLSMESLRRLQWSVPADADPKLELTPVLDYMELEVTFLEFQRFLVRSSELYSQRQGSASAVGTTAMHEHLRTFLDEVFVPSLTTPYAAASAAPPAAATPEAAEDGAAGGETAAAAKAAAGDAAAAAAGAEGGAAPDASPPPPPPDFWRGFAADFDLRRIGALPAEAHLHRWWPEGYAQEVADW